ncbi:hypothetical protein [Parapedobacter sp. DT-150]|uniref:hypothetical protein n=1 Tax=Parapedobacter sp. DT-150 TaxID=3396162 RepID=UPI003F1BB271
MASNKSSLLSLILIPLLLAPASAKAQLWKEWFQQKKTQKQYLGEQIVALHAYGAVLKTGYDVVSSGLGFIRGITDGEFNLHGLFFASLSAVSPAIRGDVRIAEIVALQVAIIAAFNGADNGHHSGYIRSVKEKVLLECAADLSELLDIVLSGKVEMDDDERLRRLDKVCTAMRDKATFTQRFTGDVRLLALMRKRETEQIDNIKNWFTHEENE